eukprot:gene5427-6771_t
MNEDQNSNLFHSVFRNKYLSTKIFQHIADHNYRLKGVVIHKGLDNLDLVFIIKYKLFTIFSERLDQLDRIDNSNNNNTYRFNNEFNFIALQLFCTNNSDFGLFKRVHQRYEYVFKQYQEEQFLYLKSPHRPGIFNPKKLNSNTILELCYGGGNIEIVKFVQEKYPNLNHDNQIGNALNCAFQSINEDISNGRAYNTDGYLELFEYFINSYEIQIKGAKPMLNHFRSLRLGKIIQVDSKIRNWFFDNKERLNFGTEFVNLLLMDAINAGDIERLKFYFSTEENRKLFLNGDDGKSFKSKNWTTDSFEMGSFILDNSFGLIQPQSLLNCKGSFVIPILQDDRYSNVWPQVPVPDRQLLNCYHNDVQLLKLLHDRQLVEFSTFSMDRAAVLGYLDIIKFLHSNRTEGCSKDALKLAASEDHFEVVKFLLENYKEEEVLDPKLSTRSLSPEMIEYLNQLLRKQVPTYNDFKDL